MTLKVENQTYGGPLNDRYGAVVDFPDFHC